jgi:alanine racemase
LKTEVQSTAPIWAEISVGALQHNFRTVQEHVGADTTVCAVVKADAYGHGSVGCAQAFEAAGAAWLGVTSVEEGMRLREGDVAARILVLRGFTPGEEEDVVRFDLTPAVWEWPQIELLEAATRRVGHNGQPVPVHLKVDTGMGRLGVSMTDLPALAGKLRSTQHVLLEGVFSHFSSAEVIDSPSTATQMRRFEEVLGMISAAGLAPIYQHLANSAAVITQRGSWKNFVRAGLALYGHFLPAVSVVTGRPDPALALPVRPALTWKTRVLSVRQMPARHPLGYSGAYVTPAPARIAALPVGYADGLNRRLSNCGRVIVRGAYAPIVGKVSMDITLVDATAIPGVEPGDEALLIGAGNGCSVTAVDHASWASTVPYEILCGISKRVPRIYVD